MITIGLLFENKRRLAGDQKLLPAGVHDDINNILSFYCRYYQQKIDMQFETIIYPGAEGVFGLESILDIRK